MTHRAESIIEKVVTAVTGLTTTGANVIRGMTASQDINNFLSVDMGAEQAIGDPNVSYQDCYLDVEITAHARLTSNVDTQLNKIHAEVYAALMATPQLALSYVFDTRWMGRSSVERNVAQQKLGQQTAVYRVHYRHSYASAES